MVYFLYNNRKVLDLLCYHLKFQTKWSNRLVSIQLQKKICKKKIFLNFQKIELWTFVKGSRPLLPPNWIHFARYITQGLFKNTVNFNLSKKKKFFSYWQLIFIELTDLQIGELSKRLNALLNQFFNNFGSMSMVHRTQKITKI